MSARYLSGDRSDELFARWRPTDGTSWYLQDRMFSVRDIASLNGVLVDHIEYDAFGQVLSETNPSAGDRFKYTGREYDAATGLYHYRARGYDPAGGRFLQQDPIGFAAGDTNLYRYVFNSPTQFRDPSGMSALAEYGILAVSIAAGMGFDVCLTDEGVEAAVFANGEKVGSVTLPGQGIPTPRSATMRFEVESCAPSYGGAYTNGVMAVVGTVIGRYWTQGLIDAGLSNELIVGFTTHWLLGLAGYSTYAEMFEGGDTYYVDPFPVPGYDLYNRPVNGTTGTVAGGAEEGMTNPKPKTPTGTQKKPGSGKSCDKKGPRRVEDVTIKEKVGKYRGGSHNEMSGDKYKGDGLDSHHMPDRHADARTTVGRGPAIQMDPIDHNKTSSHKDQGRPSIRYRAETKRMFEEGRIRDAMAREIWDVRQAAKEASENASKYNRAIQEMLEYARLMCLIPSKQ